MSLNKRLIRTNDSGGSDTSVAKWVVSGYSGKLVYTTDYTLSGSTSWTDCTHPFVATDIIYNVAYNGVSWLAFADTGTGTRIAYSNDGVTFTQSYLNLTKRPYVWVVWNGEFWTVKHDEGFFYTSDETGQSGWAMYNSMNFGSYAWSWDGSSWITSQNNEDLYYATNSNPVSAYTLWDNNNANAIYYAEKNPNGWYIATVRGGVSSAVGQNIWRYDSLGGGRNVLSSNSTFGINNGGIHTSNGALVQQTNNQSSATQYARINSSGNIISVENASVYGVVGRGNILSKAYNGYSLAWAAFGDSPNSYDLIYRTGNDVLATTGWSKMQPLGSIRISGVGSSINELTIPQINV